MAGEAARLNFIIIFRLWFSLLNESFDFLKTLRHVPDVPLKNQNSGELQPEIVNEIF